MGSEAALKAFPETMMVKVAGSWLLAGGSEKPVPLSHVKYVIPANDGKSFTAVLTKVGAMLTRGDTRNNVVKGKMHQGFRAALVATGNFDFDTLPDGRTMLYNTKLVTPRSPFERFLFPRKGYHFCDGDTTPDVLGRYHRPSGATLLARKVIRSMGRNR